MDVPHRCYKEPEAAINKTLAMLYWLELGNSYTVYNADSGKAIVQFTRKINGIYVLR